MSADWKQALAHQADDAVEHQLVEDVIAEFMGNIQIPDTGLPAAGIRKVAHYAATVARAQALGIDPEVLRLTPSEANAEVLRLAAEAVGSGVPVITVGAERSCRNCGCTDDAACVLDGQPCSWVDWDLCSACAA